MNHSYYQKWQSQEHTNVQIKVNIPFLYFAAFNRQSVFCSKSLVFDFSRTFRGVNTDFFLNFSDIFLISPTSDPSDFLLNRAVRAVPTINVNNYTIIKYRPVIYNRWDYNGCLTLSYIIKLVIQVIVGECITFNFVLTNTTHSPSFSNFCTFLKRHAKFSNFKFSIIRIQ